MIIGSNRVYEDDSGAGFIVYGKHGHREPVGLLELQTTQGYIVKSVPYYYDQLTVVVLDIDMDGMCCNNYMTTGIMELVLSAPGNSLTANNAEGFIDIFKYTGN